MWLETGDFQLSGFDPLCHGDSNLSFPERWTAPAELMGRCREADGLVTRLWNRRRTDLVSYAFTVDGVVYTGECSIATAHWANLRTAGTLPIRFFALEPWSMIQLRRDRWLAAEGAATGGVVLR